MKNLPKNRSISNRKSVILHQWWLIKVGQESKLGVGGFVKKETLESLGMRVFGSASAGKRGNLKTLENKTQHFESAAIVKKLDSNTLEAVDGKIITITGCLNIPHTLSNGFSHEVCDRFLSGFPCTWEDYVAKSTHEKCNNTTQQSFPESFDDLSVTQVCSLLMSATGESESCALTSIIFKDILKVKPCSEISPNQNATSVDYEDKDDVSLSNPTLNIIEQHDKELETSKDAEDTLDCRTNYKITEENQEKRTESQKRYPLRSTRKKIKFWSRDLDDR